MDYMNIVMKVEDQFNLPEFEEGELYNVNTPAKLINLISEKLESKKQGTCLTVKRFNYLRKILVEDLGVERKTIKLDSSFTELIPEKSEKTIWATIQSKLKKEDVLPNLRYPVSTRNVKNLMVLILILLIAMFSVKVGNFTTFAILSLGIIILIQRVYESMEKYDGSTIDPEYSTVRSLIPFIRFDEDIKSYRIDVASKVKVILVEEMGVTPEQYSEDICFFKDLYFE